LCRVRDVDDLEPLAGVRHVDVTARQRHAGGEPRRVGGAGDERKRGIRDVDDLKPGRVVGHVGVRAGNHHVSGHRAGRVQVTHGAQTLRVADVEDLEARAVSHVRIGAGDGHVEGVTGRREIAFHVHAGGVVDAIDRRAPGREERRGAPRRRAERYGGMELAHFFLRRTGSNGWWVNLSVVLARAAPAGHSALLNSRSACP
jgi:hypothetical protein